MELDLSNLGLNRLPKIPEGITILKCNNNKIKYIGNLPESLRELYCNDNEIIKIDNLPSKLEKLICFSNLLESIHIPKSVKVLYTSPQKSKFKEVKIFYHEITSNKTNSHNENEMEFM